MFCFLPKVYPLYAQLSSTWGLRRDARAYQPKVNPGADGVLLSLRYTFLIRNDCYTTSGSQEINTS